MKSFPAATWIISAFCASLILAAGVLALRGAGEAGTDAALFATARLSFLLFWPAYAGGALASLFGPVFQPLKRRGRELGLAFASAHTVHLGLIGWLCVIGAAPALQTFVFFGIAALWMYLLVLFSIGRLNRALGPRLWWIVRVVGMNYIIYAFFTDFLRNPVGGGIKHVLEYVPFVFLCVAGPALRIAVLAQRAVRGWRNGSYRPAWVSPRRDLTGT
jgi:hypothetical protein